MNLKEKEILLQACENLKATFINLDMIYPAESDVDNDSIITIAGVSFVACVKQHITGSNIESVLTEAKNMAETLSCTPLVIVGYAAPSIMEKIMESKFPVMDSAGNCNIRHGNLYLSAMGRQNTFVKDNKIKTLTESAARLIYYFLENRNLVSEPIRSISATTGFSIGMIKNTIDELSERRLILHVGKRRILSRYKELLDLWVERYNELVKPKLILRRMAFRDNQTRALWKETQLPDGMYWGGDCGAYLLDGYLNPGTFEIYTDKSSAHLMTTGLVRPDENGEIIIYKKFWKGQEQAKTAPLLIVYADLMGTGDGRCIEAAKRLIEKWDIS